MFIIIVKTRKNTKKLEFNTHEKMKEFIGLLEENKNRFEYIYSNLKKG